MEATTPRALRCSSRPVSIHASVMEATRLVRRRPRVHGVSIHASVMEATSVFDFMARFREVSIHASVMEATCAAVANARNSTGFDPRLRDGGDMMLRLRPVTVRLFRSTPP